MHGAVPLRRTKPFRMAKDENKTEAPESRFPKEVVWNSPKVTATTVAESGKFWQAQFCWSLLKTWPRNMRHWSSHRIEEDLRSPDSFLIEHVPQLFQQESGGINPFHISKKQVSRIKEFKAAKDQIAIYLGLFLTSGASCGTLKELIYWLPNWIGFRELM